MSTLAARIQDALDHSGISWSKAATSIGLSAQAATKWKRGQISKETLKDLSQFLNVDYTWLATGEGQMTADNIPQPSTQNYEPSTSTIEFMDTFKEMERSGELTPQVIGLLNNTLNPVKRISGKRSSVSHLVEMPE